MHPGTLIIGGGILGISTAYYLARRGHRVVVLDDGDGTTSASAGNAGILALGHPPLPRPGLVWQTVKWMFDEGSPLYMPMRFDPGLWSWMWQFRRACTSSHFDASWRHLGELGHAAGEAFHQIIEEESIDCDYRPAGFYEVFTSETGMAAAHEDAERLADMGFTVESIDGDTLRRHEPALGPNVVGATHYRESISIHPGEFLRQFAAAAERQGVEFRRPVRVQRLQRDGGRIAAVETEDGERSGADTYMLAAGAWTTGLAATADVAVPQQPGKGYHVHVPQPDPPLQTGCVLAERHIAVTPMHEQLRLAGTVELSGMNLRQVPRRLEMLTEGAADFIPGIADAVTTPGWCGLRPCTADGLPIVDWAPGVENLFVATGHAKMGMTLGPVTGRLISEWMLDGRPSIDLSLTRADRF